MKTTPGAEPGRPRRHDRQEECLTRPREPLPTRVEGLPPLPGSFHDRLDAALRAIPIDLPPAGRAAIEGHVRLLIAWNAGINLTATSDPGEIATRHVGDSLTAVPIVRELSIDALLDLGSGGGFPGVPLAAALPLGRVGLVESTTKKARFLQTVAVATGLAPRVSVHAVRAEALAADPRHREAWPAVTARAVASLAELVELAFPFIAPEGRLIAWKRRPLDVELAAAGRAVGALGGGRIETRSVAVIGLEEHELVVVTKSGRTPAGYPREPAARRRDPW